MNKKVFGIIGYPVAHSLSPIMHNAAFSKLKIAAEYLIFEVQPKELGDFIVRVRQKKISGFSVTIPHKISVMKFLDKIEDQARKIGAVNTIINKNGVLIGANTDCDGAITALQTVTTLKGKKVVVIGAGGAARAIIYGLKQKGANVIILNRTKEKALLLAQEFGVKADSLDNIDRYSAEIVINATSVGMAPNINESPIPAKYFQKGMIVFDVVYKPLLTKFLLEAKKAGCQIITGEKMLLYQGVRQFELWTKEKAPVFVMQKALEEQLK